MSDRQKALILIILGALIGGGTSPITKIGLNSIPPLSFVFLRFLIAAACITPFVFRNKGGYIKSFLSLVPLSLFGTVNIILFILGIRVTTATIGQLLYAAVPLLTGLIAFLFFRKKLRLRQIFGIFLGFFGVSMVIMLPVLENGKSFSGNLVGNILISVGVTFWSFYMAYSKKILSSYSPLIITSAFIYVTSIATFPFFVFDLLRYPYWWEKVNFSGLLSLGYIALIATIVSYLLNQYAIKHGGSVFASTSYYLLPIFTFFSANILLGEMMTFGLFIGGLFALLGIFLVM